MFGDGKGEHGVFSLFFTGPYRLTGPSGSVAGAFESEWGHTRWLMIPQAQSFIDNVLKKDPRTAGFFWEVGVPVDVSEHGAIDVPSIGEGAFEYDIVAVSTDKNSLVFGHRGFEPPMRVEQRHSVLSCDVLVRVNDFDARVGASLRWKTSSLARSVAVLGQGKLGSALGKVLSGSGQRVVYGTRSGPISFDQAVADAQVVVIALPSEVRNKKANFFVFCVKKNKKQHVASTISNLKLDGKLVIDASNPVGEGFTLASNGANVQALLGGKSEVIKCFNTIGSASLANPMSGAIRKDMFFCGGGAASKEWLSRVIESIGFRPVDMGDWSHAKLLESLAVLWIYSAFAAKRGANIAWKLI